MRYLENFAIETELQFDADSNRNVAYLGFQVEYEFIMIGYRFDANENFYEFSSAVCSVDNKDYQKKAFEVITGKPIHGITERLVNGKLVVLGYRDNLVNQSEMIVRRMFMDNVARVTEAYLTHRT
jgi:hypothetical protein